jgi:P4 family phage/plasmid primase-like protien
MAQKSSLRDFLESHKTDGVWTHTALNGGKYFVGDDDLKTFYDLYIESILDQEKQFITEKNTEVGPPRVDFDFIYENSVQQHLHTQEQVRKFSTAYINELSQYVVLPLYVDVYIMEKRKPTYDAKKNKVKSGIHIVIPGVATRKFVEQRIRRALVKRMDEFFPDLPLIEPWDKVYDEGVVNRSVNWTLYGSRKPDINSLPYLVSYILRWDGKEFQMITDSPKLTTDFIRMVSVRRDEKDETPMTEEGKSLYSNLPRSEPSQQKQRGRPLTRSEKPSSRGSSPNARINPELDPEKREYYRRHILNLNPDRANDYAKWIQVGLCLHNIHTDLLDVFLDFSSQDDKKYNEADCIQKWNSLTYRNDGDKLGEGTLRYWSRDDNYEGYMEIEEENIERLVLAACSLAEFDTACVIHAKFRDNYKCSDFKNNVWYRWSGHVWRETDSGVDLLLRLSREVAKIFFKKMTEIQNDMDNRGWTECMTPVDKKDCGKCDYCLMDAKRLGLNNVHKKLKTTAFKSNVMRECRELFYDGEFNKKMDANKDLIAFENGVFDTTTMEFRDGKPEDYITFSTGIDYDSNKQYYEYPEWSRVEKFLHQVLPDAEVREYFVKHLATNLIGGNPAQKFHILTGSGSNGKSMITNLMTRVLGDYACTVPISLMTQKRKSSGSAAPEVARLRGRRFVTMQEPDEAIALNTGLMKEITSCEKMYARDLFKSGGEFEVQGKFHLACNDKPKINTTDGGTWRRLVVINFISKFVSNPTAPNEFPLDESIQFAVNSVEWAVPFASYLIHVLKNSIGLRKLVAPDKVMEYTAEYRNENDAIAKFITDKIRTLENDEKIEPIDKQQIMKVFRSWKDDNDQKTLSPADMIKRIELLYGKYHRGGWTNFKIE